ncbi:hypothetical protein CS542_01710 [Pedobacter sp. IW39]|nr:hypothetical protein CS542_01710 [Pedobacter sp. IW39]
MVAKTNGSMAIEYKELIANNEVLPHLILIDINACTEWLGVLDACEKLGIQNDIDMYALLQLRMTLKSQT